MTGDTRGESSALVSDEAARGVGCAGLDWPAADDELPDGAAVAGRGPSEARVDVGPPAGVRAPPATAACVPRAAPTGRLSHKSRRGEARRGGQVARAAAQGPRLVRRAPGDALGRSCSDAWPYWGHSCRLLRSSTDEGAQAPTMALLLRGGTRSERQGGAQGAHTIRARRDSSRVFRCRHVAPPAADADADAADNARSARATAGWCCRGSRR